MTPESDIAPEVRKTGRGWVDLSAAACALIISVTSLWVGVRHGHTMERMADSNARLVSATIASRGISEGSGDTFDTRTPAQSQRPQEDAHHVDADLSPAEGFEPTTPWLQARIGANPL